MAFFSNFRRSAAELKNIRCIVVTAVLIALDLALKGVTIQVTNELKISFAFLALASVGMLYGPVVSFMAGVITDVIGFLLFTASQGGVFNPMFTAIEAIGAMIYGIFLYDLKYAKIDLRNFKSTPKEGLKQVGRIAIAKAAVVVVCNLLLTPTAIVLNKFFMSGEWIVEPTLIAYPARLIKNCVQYPVDCVLLVLVLFPVMLAYRSVFRVQSSKEGYKT